MPPRPTSRRTTAPSRMRGLMCACNRWANARRETLTAILCELATCCSTSGVEQNFSRGAWGFQDRQLVSDMQHERSTHRLLLYDGP
eukprot:8532086-Lingulodinium_polyedra.AAC.1